MSIKMADGISIKISSIGKWFTLGFILFTIALNVRGISGFLYSII